jgi:ribose transport system substrate-binding protein
MGEPAASLGFAAKRRHGALSAESVPAAKSREAMRRSAILLAAAAAVCGVAKAAGVNELPFEVGSQLFDPALIDAGLPVGVSPYRDWKSKKAPPWTFGFVGSTRFGSWSEAALKKARDDLAPKWANFGLGRPLVAPPAAANDAEASREIRELADEGVDAILVVCCANAAGLNEAIQYAHGKGALTVTLLGFSTSPYALNATTNFALEGEKLAEQTSDDIKDKGNVLVVGGFLRDDSAQAFDRGVRIGLAKHPGLKLAGDIAVAGGADAARAATEAWLKSHRDPVDAVIARAGADSEILQAFSDAARKTPVVTIGDDLASLCAWRQNLDFGRRAFIGWPPAAETALAWNVAMRTLQGQGPKTQSILAEPISISSYTVRTQVPENCQLDSGDWFPVDDEVWTSRRTLDGYFLRPADPSLYSVGALP